MKSPVPGLISFLIVQDYTETGCHSRKQAGSHYLVQDDWNILRTFSGSTTWECWVSPQLIHQHTPRSPQCNSQISRHFGQMKNLIQGVAIAVGCVTLLATVGSCHVWLGLTALEREDRKDLLRAPIAPDTLFGFVSSVT